MNAKWDSVEEVVMAAFYKCCSCSAVYQVEVPCTVYTKDSLVQVSGMKDYHTHSCNGTTSTSRLLNYRRLENQRK